MKSILRREGAKKGVSISFNYSILLLLLFFRKRFFLSPSSLFFHFLNIDILNSFFFLQINIWLCNCFYYLFLKDLSNVWRFEIFLIFLIFIINFYYLFLKDLSNVWRFEIFLSSKRDWNLQRGILFFCIPFLKFVFCWWKKENPMYFYFLFMRLLKEKMKRDHVIFHFYFILVNNFTSLTLTRANLSRFSSSTT